MPEWSRRRALAVFGAGTLGIGGYWWFGEKRCIDRREPQWTLDGRYWSPPVTDDYSIYVSEGYGLTDTDGVHRIASLDKNRGSPNWVFTEVGAGGGVPLIADETVYVGTGQDQVYALDKQSGRVNWQYDAGGRETHGGGAWGQPLKIDERVLVGISHSDIVNPGPSNSDAFTHRLVALDAESGEEVWAQTVDPMVWTGPVAVGETVIAATEAGTVYGFAVGDGTKRWQTKVGTKIRRPMFSDGTVYIASEDGQIGALAPESGAKRWTDSVPTAIQATECDDERFYIGTDSGAVRALALSGGTEHWQAESEAAIADISSVGSTTYVLDQQGYIHVRDAESGELSQRFRIAENAGSDRCGWNPKYERAIGLLAGEDDLTVTGPWVGRIRR